MSRCGGPGRPGCCHDLSAPATRRCRARHAARSTPPGKIIYSDAPTVRVVESQGSTAPQDRAPRRRRARRYPRDTGWRGTAFRITLKSVVRMADAATSQSLSAARGQLRPARAGTVDQRIDRAARARDESRSSVFHYLERGSGARFHAHQGALARNGGRNGRVRRDADSRALAGGGIRSRAKATDLHFFRRSGFSPRLFSYIRAA